MPTSHPYQLNEILEAVIKTRPNSVLDIGVGFGKYGVLVREYLELWNENQDYRNWKYQIDGIEAFEEYLTPLHSFIYNKIYVGDAAKVLPTISHHYDLILLIDVIEHFTEDEATSFLKICLKHARNVLVSTPTIVAEQGDAFQNDYETHRSQWTREQFEAFPNSQQLGRGDESLIFFIGEDAHKVKLGRMERFRRNWPVLRSISRTLKRMLHR